MICLFWRRSHRHLCKALAAALVSFSSSGGISAADKGNGQITSEQALARLESLLGKYEARDARQFRMAFKTRTTSQPDPRKAAVDVESQGERIFGTPYQTGNSTVCFDLVELANLTVSRAGDPAAIVVRRQQRYLVARFALNPTEDGRWQFACTFKAHSIPDLADRTYLTGEVQWLNDGIKLSGIGRDTDYAPDGSVTPVAKHCQISMIRKGNGLSVSDKWQSYVLATDPTGASLPMPDFARPIGRSTTWLTGFAEGR
jgi:hypothetical protein